MVYPHSVIVSVACLLLPSWKSSHSPIVPLVRGIQFVSKALLQAIETTAPDDAAHLKANQLPPVVHLRKTHF